MDTQETVEEKIQPEMVQKTGNTKRETLRLLKTAEHVPATRWTAHVHRMIKEANPLLLKDPAVISAFNALTDVLLKHQEHVYGFGPCNNHKYEQGVHIDMHPEDPLKDICEVRWKSVYYDQESGRPVIRSKYYRRVDGPPEQEKEVRDEVIRTYRVLFELIKGDVLPYMSRMASEKERKEREKAIQHTMERMERIQALHDHEMERFRIALEMKENQFEYTMNRYRDVIARLSAEK
jgi:hypothetical protein